MALTHTKRPIAVDAVTHGFQIAPMIDVVFVIMLFFLAMAGTIRVEHAMKMTLPGIPRLIPNTVFCPPDELLVEIQESGSVLLNEEELDPANDKKMVNFTSAMNRLKLASWYGNSQPLVTIHAEELAPYQRIIDVLNAMAKVQLTNVTFTVGEDG